MADSDASVRKGLMIIVSGPSGVGKGTVLKELFARRHDCVRSISATTRSPRPGEVPGEQYYFFSQAQFLEGVKEGMFLEWNQHFSNYYGTPKKYVEEQRLKGKHVIMEIDVGGGLDVMRLVPDCLTVFIAPPDLNVLENRLRGRASDSEEQIVNRLLVAHTELKHMELYGYVIVNDDLQEAVQTLSSIIDAEMSKTSRVVADRLLPFMDEIKLEP